MNNLKKQILSAAVAASTVLSLVPAVSAAVPAEIKGTRYEEPVQVLSALEIMVGDENGLFRLDDTIIRSEVAKLAIHTMGLEDAAESSKGQTVFYDVPTDHWANGYINLAVAHGIIEGDGDGNFRPNDPITYAEAMTIMVQATGYSVSAEEAGGYPYGYITVGTSNGLAKNVQGSAREEISRGNVAFLTTNALEVPLMEKTGFGSNERYEITDKTLLKDRLNVTKGKGQVTAVENTSITGSSKLGENQVEIDEKLFETAYNMNDLLGYNIEYYLREDKAGSQIILGMPIKSQNSDLVISSDLFSKLTKKNGNDAVEYFKDENSSKTTVAEISADAVLIYNGKRADMDTALIDMSDKSGMLTLLDTNKDGKYNIVFVRSYENIVVDRVSATKVSDKYSDKTLKLDENVDFRLVKGLEEITLSDLNEYDVLSVYASLDNDLLDIAVTTKTIKGKVTSKNSDGLLIDGERYKVAPNYTESITVGSEGVFHLDIDNKIAAVDGSVNLSSNYGYLTKAYYSENEDKAIFRIFTMDNKEITFDGNDKIKYNGKSGTKAEDVVKGINGEGSTEKQLVTYAVNSDNKLTAIETATDNTATGAVSEDKFTKNYVLEDAKYSKSLSKLGNVRIDEETVIFDVQDSTEEYAIRDMSVLEDKQKYNAVIYDMTENYTAKAIVLTNAKFSATATAPLAVVKEVTTAANDEDEQTDLLIALVEGKEVSLYAENETVLNKGEGKLEEGDLIQYKTNAKDEIVGVRLLLDIQSKDTEAFNTPDEDLVTVYGKVTRKFASSLNVKVNDEAESNYAVPEDAAIYVVDTTKSKNNITVGDMSDIQVFDADDNNRVFIKIYDDVVKEIVVIK